MASNSRVVSVTRDFSAINNLKDTFEAHSKLGFAYICIPIVNSHFKREFFEGKAKDRKGAFTRSDLCLSSFDWAAVIGKVSPYIDCDSINEYVRKSSEATLLDELNYACHVNMAAVMIPLTGPNVVNLSRVIMSKLVPTTSIQIWLKVPMISLNQQRKVFYKNEDKNAEPMEDDDTWEWWNRARTITGWQKRVMVALELCADMPAVTDLQIQRWLGEPVRALVLPTHVFVTNKKGFPVLTRHHQAFVHAVATHCHEVNYVVTGACRHKNIDLYLRYIQFLVEQRKALNDPYAAYSEGYEDFLQYPLQPLADNLESQTYEVFEKDPIKYNKYQEAIYHALMDRVSFEEKDHNVQIVMVVGAGRGPLVSATLNAARLAKRLVKVYAVEKNPNAILTLESRLEEEWRGLPVIVVSSDMRDFRPAASDMADIVVSELLGSFGDNELSPECLDGVTHLMKEDAISIPASYTSYLGPTQSMKLHCEVRSYKDRLDKSNPFEMPYVVHQKNCFAIDQPKDLFTFYHPSTEKDPDNTRYAALEFDVKIPCVLHGFSGYFTTVLYRDIILSIHPDTHSPGMFSWFPIFFPIQDPIQLKAGDRLQVNFWRLVDKEKVWYEWAVTKPTTNPNHNTNGRSYSIKLR
ncbi:protein arginine N-methyltransferase 5 [Nilaparvata lugens]|uniref:protein arginine N-methyltransferase 5 n=1 Tax=Nilaparvata lugens TaxID=108931 RepID=UPI00193D32D8|nr:protein arginine N-methyltransferase 5 [Nilaparvata lugens]